MAPELMSDAVPLLVLATGYRGAQRGTAPARCGTELRLVSPFPVSGKRFLACPCPGLYPVRRGAALWRSFAMRGAFFPYATHEEEL